jgi:hypothetical protein
MRYDAERTDAGHADEFWALALAVHASPGEQAQRGGRVSFGGRTAASEW